MSAAEEATRARLSKALHGDGHSLRFGQDGYVLDNLLTVVRQLQAEALEDAAEDLPATPGLQYIAHDWLRNRAAGLRGIR